MYQKSQYIETLYFTTILIFYLYNQYQLNMNFNRIQKYRADKLTVQQNPYTGNHHFRTKQTAASEIKKQPLAQPHEIISKEMKIANKNGSNESYINSSSITLRDYMYITSKSLKKQDEKKQQSKSKVALQNSSSQSSISLEKKVSFARKDKYDTSNQEIIQIVKADIKNDLNKIFETTEEISNKFENIFEAKNLTNTKMIELYKIRKLLRQNVLKQLKGIDQIVSMTSIRWKAQKTKEKIIVINEEQEKRDHGHSTLVKSIYYNERDVQLKKDYSLSRK